MQVSCQDHAPASSPREKKSPNSLNRRLRDVSKRSNLLYLSGIEFRAVKILVYAIAFRVFVYHCSFGYF